MDSKGFKSTEFWLSVIGTVGIILGALWGSIPSELALKLSSYIICAYTIGRSIAKLTPSQTDDKIFEAIEQRIIPIVSKKK